MRRALSLARGLYQPPLADGETVRWTLRATAAGTGTNVVLGATTGALLGWLAAILLEAAVLPLIVMGALAGELFGYLRSEFAARKRNGAGTIHVDLVLTSSKLITLPRYGFRRNRALRTYPLEHVVTSSMKRYPIADYHLLEIKLEDGSEVRFVVEGVPQMTPVTEGLSSG